MWMSTDPGRLLDALNGVFRKEFPDPEASAGCLRGRETCWNSRLGVALSDTSGTDGPLVSASARHGASRITTVVDEPREPHTGRVKAAALLRIVHLLSCGSVSL